MGQKAHGHFTFLLKNLFSIDLLGDLEEINSGNHSLVKGNYQLPTKRTFENFSKGKTKLRESAWEDLKRFVATEIPRGQDYLNDLISSYTDRTVIPQAQVFRDSIKGVVWGLKAVPASTDDNFHLSEHHKLSLRAMEDFADWSYEILSETSNSSAAMSLKLAESTEWNFLARGLYNIEDDFRMMFKDIIEVFIPFQMALIFVELSQENTKMNFSFFSGAKIQSELLKRFFDLLKPDLSPDDKRQVRGWKKNKKLPSQAKFGNMVGSVPSVCNRSMRLLYIYVFFFNKLSQSEYEIHHMHFCYWVNHFLSLSPTELDLVRLNRDVERLVI